MKDYEKLPLIPIKKGEGVYIEDFEGNRYIDAISSWWVNLFGHNNRYISSKIKKQLKKIEHIIFAGFTHKQIVKLSKRLVEITPKGLNKCFYADNGSSAIEIALKMSFHYYKNRGEIRRYFLSLTNSYHGETIGALGVSDVGLYKEPYRELLITPLYAPVPKDMSEESAIDASIKLEEIFKKHRGEISAFILEPLVQCAGGMKIYSPLYLKKARELCDKYDIFLIADEIAVGFGRTGKMFACEYADITPDFLCLSKGITGGFLPLSVVLLSDEVYNSFYCDYSSGKSFLHSHSYTGNALACASANATLDIFEKENILEKNREKIKYFADKIKIFKTLSNLKEVRQQGMIIAIELEGYKAEERIGLKIFEYALKEGVFIRPLGNVVYFMPPYIISLKEIDKIVEVTYKAIKNIE